jgi:hypothetical protein
VVPDTKVDPLGHEVPAKDAPGKKKVLPRAIDATAAAVSLLFTISLSGNQNRSKATVT